MRRVSKPRVSMGARTSKASSRGRGGGEGGGGDESESERGEGRVLRLRQRWGKARQHRPRVLWSGFPIEGSRRKEKASGRRTTASLVDRWSLYPRKQNPLLLPVSSSRTRLTWFGSPYCENTAITSPSLILKLRPPLMVPSCVLFVIGAKEGKEKEK